MEASPPLPVAFGAELVAIGGSIAAQVAGRSVVADSAFAVATVGNIVVAVVEGSLLGQQQIHPGSHIDCRWVAVAQDSMAYCTLERKVRVVSCAFLVDATVSIC